MVVSGSDYVRQLLDGYFLTLVSGSEFYLATPFDIGNGIAVALPQINGHKIVFYVLMVGYLNHIVDIFVRDPDMPGPEDGITRILDRNDGIALPDRRTVHFERDIAAIGTGIVFYIRNQVHRILPDQFGLGRRTSITADVWIRDPVPGMVDERIQDIGPCCRGGIRRNVRGRVLDRIAIYQRQRIVTGSADHVTVGRVLNAAPPGAAGKVVRCGFRTLGRGRFQGSRMEII